MTVTVDGRTGAVPPGTGLVETAAAAGIVAVIQPGGSVRDAEVIAAAKAAYAHHFIESLPGGYDTSVGELGSQLARRIFVLPGSLDVHARALESGRPRG